MKNINNYNILKTQILLMFAFVLTLVALMANENTDTNTSTFTFILYLPYVFILCIYNGIFLKLLLSFLKSNLLIYLLPIVPFIVWFLISNYSITIRFWKFNGSEVIIGLIIMIFVNSIGFYFFNPNKKIEEK